VAEGCSFAHRLLHRYSSDVSLGEIETLLCNPGGDEHDMY
jgi:hypothetical protein